MVERLKRRLGEVPDLVLIVVTPMQSVYMSRFVTNHDRTLHELSTAAVSLRLLAIPRWRLTLVLLLTPSWICRRGIRPSSGIAAVLHGDDIRTIFQRLFEVAYVADDFNEARYGEGDDGNKAKGEERAALDDTARHVATVVALADDALVALDFGPEGVLAADEEEEDHDCCCLDRKSVV